MGLAGLVIGAVVLGVWSGDAVEGRVVRGDGGPAAGAMVSAVLADGRSVTVYADARGGFRLPDEATGAERLVAWLPGEGRVELEGPADTRVELRLEPDAEPSPAGAAWLAGLPQGEDSRRFILDCTGCHVTDGTRVRPGGEPRDSASWHAAVSLMAGRFGPGTGFPIISSWARPGPLAGWLSRVFRDAEPTAGGPAGPVPAAASGSPVLTEFPVPVPQDLPHDLAVAPGGEVLVTGMFTHGIYRLDPASGAFDVTPIPVPNANPRAIEVDAAGRWWVVLGAPGQVAVHDPAAGSWRSHDVGMYAHSIALAPDGRGWVNGHFTHEPELLAVVDHPTGEVRELTVPSSGDAESTVPYGLRAAADGTVWGTQLRGNRLLRVDPVTGEVRRWAMPVSHAGPRRPDPAPDGSVWIPLYGANALARFDPEGETFRVWDFPVEGALPYVARVDARTGLVWIGTGHGDVVASFDPATEDFTLYPLPTRGALVRHLDVDPERGEVWFAYGASPGIPGKILRLRPGGG